MPHEPIPDIVFIALVIFVRISHLVNDAGLFGPLVYGFVLMHTFYWLNDGGRK